MNSSTSNSKMKFIGRFLITTAVLLVAYHFTIPLVKDIPVEYQSQNQDNAIKVEGFLFGPANMDVLIVGSSLTARLDHDFIMPHSYNLAMGGESAITGLEILKQSGKTPKLVVIEGNVLLPKDEAVIKASLGQPNYALKKISPIFREQFQPVTVFNGYLKSFFKRSVKAFNAEGFEIGLQEQIKATKEVTEADKKYWSERLAEVAGYVSELKAKGVRIVFVSMPTHKDVYNAPLSVFQREALTHYLTQQGISLILPDGLNYQTTDGLHLDPGAVGVYSRFLESQIAKYTL